MNQTLLAVMLEVLILSLEIMQEETSTFGLEINWGKTQIQFCSSSAYVQVAGNAVDIVESLPTSVVG